ncbi:SpoIIE family protein phosphatase [Actinocorallia populi]|uniref:SpoIIE family protein phosphatase n=1 Tax=Actinocorallia populi TaxID=2079200 RepID=UPI00130062D9|nr:SpoIIE family protein phosphatase [Actinocorallia populi]
MTRSGLDDLMRRRTTGARSSDPTRWLAELAAPAMVDFALMYVTDQVLTGVPRDGEEALRLRRTACVGGDPALVSLFPEKEPVVWARGAPTLRALVRGEAVRLEAAGDGDAARLAADLGEPRLAQVLCSRMVLLLPLLDGELLVGAILLLSAAPLPEHRLEELAETARWTGQALGAGRELRDRLAVVAELERAALPPEEVHRPGLEVAARLKEPLDGHWCDVLTLPAGRTGLVIGDAGGPGPRAAARLVRLRAQLQALVLAEPVPGRVLDLLDAAVRQEGITPENPAVGCLYAVYDPASGEMQLSSAGRITSVLVRPDGHAELLDPAPAPPLGTGHPAYPTRFLSPGPGSLMLLGTRGLTLVGHDLMGVGLPPVVPPKLTETGGFAGVGGLSGLCERLLRDAGRGAVALLAVRLPAPAREAAREAAPRAPGRRPGRDGEFVGRTTELHEVRRLLEDARLVTITGGPGIGKSRLAAESAASLVHDFPDGVVGVDLTAVRSASEVPRAVEGALRETVGFSLVELTDRRLLLVLDGCDGLLEHCALFVRSLLRAAPRLRVLGTGRQPFGLTGEHVLPLSPLGLDSAARLFTSLAGPRPAGEDPVDVRRLCARLDAVPLMVELAACSAPPGTDAAALAERFDALGDFAGFGDQAAADAARAAVERSHESCTERERLLWARLSVFRGRFDLYAVEQVCVDERLPVEETLRALSALVGKSVVSSELGRRGRGYRLLHGVRGYGEERLAELPERASLLARRDAWLAGGEGRDL